MHTKQLFLGLLRSHTEEQERILLECQRRSHEDGSTTANVVHQQLKRRRRAKRKMILERQQALGGPNQHGQRLLRRYSKLTQVTKPRQAGSVEAAPDTCSSNFESEKIEDTRDAESQLDVSGQKGREAARHLRNQQDLQEIIANTLSTELLHDQVSQDRTNLQNELTTKYANMDLECRNLIQRAQHDISSQAQQKMK